MDIELSVDSPFYILDSIHGILKSCETDILENEIQKIDLYFQCSDMNKHLSYEVNGKLRLAYKDHKNKVISITLASETSIRAPQPYKSLTSQLASTICQQHHRGRAHAVVNLDLSSPRLVIPPCYATANLNILMNKLYKLKLFNFLPGPCRFARQCLFPEY